MGKSISVVIGPGRFSYANVWKPFKGDDGTEKYNTAFLIKKTDKATLKKFNKAVEQAVAANPDKLKGKKNLKLPLNDGDERETKDGKKDPAYKGCYYINASSDTQPGIVDSAGDQITDARKFYSGCIGYISVNLFAFSNKGNAGIGCGLNNVMKTEDDEPLTAGRKSAAEDFEDIIVDSDDEDYDSDLY